jgi:lipopolysaccharide export system protein LptC
MNFRHPLVISLIIALAVLSSWLVWEIQRSDDAVISGAERSDYVLHQFEMTTLNESGKEAFRLTAPYLERDPKGESISIRTPVFSFPDKKNGKWLAKSGSAWVGPGADEVRLQEQVEMVGPTNPKGLNTVFKTERLSIFPEKNTASTQQPVTITRGSSILQGRGLQVDMQSKRFQLLADVKGRYAPSRK